MKKKKEKSRNIHREEKEVKEGKDGRKEGTIQKKKRPAIFFDIFKY